MTAKRLKFLMSIFLLSGLILPTFSDAQTVCPPGYALNGDACCSTNPAVEIPGTKSVPVYGDLHYCIKKGAMPGERVCQVSGNSFSIWCRQELDRCGHVDISTLLGLTADLCIPPRPPEPSQICSIYPVTDNITGQSATICCDNRTEELGPGGEAHSAPYCQPKKDTAGRIIPPLGRPSCLSGTGTNSKENWCCPPGQVASLHHGPNSTPYCAIIKPLVSWAAPLGGAVYGPVNVQLKLLGRATIDVYLRKADNGEERKLLKHFQYEDGAETSEYGAGAENLAESAKPTYHLRSYSFTWDSKSVADGSYSLWAETADDFGVKLNGSPATIALQVDNTPTAVTIDAPVNDSKVADKTTITVSSSGKSSRLEVWIDSNSTAPIAKLDKPVGQKNFDWDTSFWANGPHTLQAILFDSQGQRTFSKIVNVKINNPCLPAAKAEATNFLLQVVMSDKVWYALFGRPLEIKLGNICGPVLTDLSPPVGVFKTNPILISFRADSPLGIRHASIALSTGLEFPCEPVAALFSMTNVVSNLTCSQSVAWSLLPIGTTVTLSATDASPQARNTAIQWMVANGGASPTGRDNGTGLVAMKGDVRSLPPPTTQLFANHTRETTTVGLFDPLELSWTSTNASYCDAGSSGYPNSRAWVPTPNRLETIGHTDLILGLPVGQTAKFFITCYNASGVAATDSVSVTSVDSTPTQSPVYTLPLPTADLKANGVDDLVTGGLFDQVRLSWTSTNAVRCASGSENYNNPNWVSDNLWTADSRNIVTGAIPYGQTAKFFITCYNAEGAAASDSVLIRQSETAPNPISAPTPTPIPIPADIKVNGSDGPVTIDTNPFTTFQVSWSSGNNTNHCASGSTNYNGTWANDNLWTADTRTLTGGAIPFNQTAKFFITCYDTQGHSASDSVEVRRSDVVGLSNRFNLATVGEVGHLLRQWFFR